MKKAILTILSIVAFSSIVFSSKGVYCMDPEMWRAMGLDPNASSSIESYKGETETQLNALDLDGDGWIDPAEVDAVNNGTASSYKSNPAPAQSSSPAPSQPSSKDSGKQAAAEKIMVYFTDCYGHVIGKSEVTAGTTIANSQFPASVEPIDGKTFDKWDYDGSVMLHDYIVRAVYKK